MWLGWFIKHSAGSKASEWAQFLVDLILQLAMVVLGLRIWVEMTEVALGSDDMVVWGVVSVFDLHAGVLGDVDKVSNFSISLHVVLGSHEHVECLVGFSLAVLNASKFSIVFWCGKIKFNAVLVALLEQHFWKCMLLEGCSKVHWVLTPVWCHCISLYKYK